MTSASSRQRTPRLLIEVGWALGLEGKRVRIGECRDRRTRLLRQLLREAEERVHDVRDARQSRLKKTWKGMRREAEDRAVSLGTMHNGIRQALNEIGWWWTKGERARVRRILELPNGEWAYSIYRRARREVAAGHVPTGIEDVVFRVALDSIRASWWQQPPLRRGMQLVEETLTLAEDMLDGERDIRDRVSVAAARMGLPEKTESFLYEAIRRAVHRTEERRRQRQQERGQERRLLRRRTRWVPKAS